MTPTAPPRLAVGELSVFVRSETERLTAVFLGTADSRAFEALAELLPQLHAEAEGLSAREVVVDMRDLEFMNSSCFKTFVTWISTVKETGDDKRYHVRFLSDPEKHWQKRSLHALRCFATDDVTIDR